MTSQASGRAGGKRRAPMSCDRCKSRKTKCVDPVPGPCQFCASIGAACHLDPSRRRQRPYYHVSEEEFRYMTKALEHFLPNVELNLQSLREIVTSFDVVPKAESTSAAGASPDSVVVVNDVSHTTPVSMSGMSATVKSEDTSVTMEEIDELHGELGWLRVDSKGTYRHVGADSGYTFHAAVRSLRLRRESESAQSDIVPPFTVAPPLPISTSDASPGGPPSNKPPHGSGSGRRTQIFLPRRDLCNRCVSRFFRDIQSVYWFYSAERFYAILDRLYAGDQSSASPSTLCSLYAILSLTSQSEAQAGIGDAATAGPPPAARYLSLAKALVPALCDEADIDSVRALCLLSLALQSSMFSNTAYVYIGAAARIALTLGLHLEKAIEAKGCLQQQIDLRLYSTLFLLDLDIALCYGNPPAVSDSHAASKPQDLSEQILSPGSHMPLGYLSVSCQLAQTRRHLSKLLYARTTATTTGTTSRPTIGAVSDALAALRSWHAAIPPHLCDASRAASFHQRSVSVLHLRYWSTVIFATRPFLLYSAVHPEELALLAPAKRETFETFCTTCVEAAQRSLGVVELMRDSGLLSSLVTVDTSCIIEVLQVFLLALARGQAERAEDVRTCLHTLQGMEQIFWTSHVLAEVMAQLDEHGLINGDNRFSPQGETPGHFFLDISQQQQHGMMSGVMEAYFSDLQDPFFTVHDDTPMIGDHFHDGLPQTDGPAMS